MGDFVFNVEQQPLPKNLSNVTHAKKLIDKVSLSWLPSHNKGVVIFNDLNVKIFQMTWVKDTKAWRLQLSSVAEFRIQAGRDLVYDFHVTKSFQILLTVCIFLNSGDANMEYSFDW